MVTKRSRRPDPNRKTVLVDLHGARKLMNLIEAAGHKAALDGVLPPEHAQARISSVAYKKVIDLIDSTPGLRDSVEIRSSVGCDPFTEPDCIGF